MNAITNYNVVHLVLSSVQMYTRKSETDGICTNFGRKLYKLVYTYVYGSISIAKKHKNPSSREI